MMTSQEEFDIVEKYIKSRSNKVKKSGNGIVFNCFYHDDSNPSASWKMGRNKPLGYCAVCGSIYHRLREDAGIRKEKTGGEEFTPFEKFIYYNMKDEYKIYDFVTEKYLCSHFRMKNKEKHGFPRGVRNGDHITKGTDNIDTTYAVFCDSYLKNIKETINNGGLICYAEGEKDARTLNQNGFLAFTCGGVNTFKKELLPYLKGGKFVVFGDNDEVGKKDAEQITSLLNTVGEAVMIIPPEVPLKGDVSDFLKIHTREDLQKLIDSVMSKSVKETVRNDGSKSEAKPIDLMQFHLVGDNGRITGVFDYAIFEHIKAHYNIFICGNPYVYENGVYISDHQGTKVKKIIREYLYPQYRKSRIINQIYCLILEADELQKDFSTLNQYPKSYINFLDCMLDVETMKEIPHNPDFFSINQIPHKWQDVKRVAEGKEIEKFFNFIFPSADDREMFLEYGGLCLTTDTRQQRFLTLCGIGGTGKSVLIRLLEAAAGAKNISNVALQDLNKRFSTSLLVGKILNSCADLSMEALEDSSVIKRLSGEDLIMAEKKGQNAFMFKNYSKLVFSTNSLPIVTTERTNGFFRRLLVIKIDKVPENPDMELADRLIDEITYFIKLAVEALHEMYQRGIITISENSKKAVLQMRKDSDVVEAWISERCTIEAGLKVDRGIAFEDFKKYCESEERQPLTRNGFFGALRKKSFAEAKLQGYWYFKGISIGKNFHQNGIKTSPDGFLELSERDLKDLPFN